MEKTVKMSNKDIDDTLSMLAIIIRNVEEGKMPALAEDPKFSYVIGRNIRILKTENIEFNDAKNNALRRYGDYYEDEENGSGYRINMKNNEQVEAFEKAISEIAKIEHDVTVFAVPLETFLSWKLPFTIQTALWFLIEDPENMFEV